MTIPAERPYNLDGVEYITIRDGAGHYLDLPALTSAERDSLSPDNGMLIYNSSNNRIEAYENGSWGPIGSGSGVSAFLDLTDTPSSYAGDAGLAAKVKSTEDGLEFSKLDHGDALTGLDDDDHPQYLLADGTRALTGNWDVNGYNISSLGKLSFDAATELTISGGAITITQSVHTVDTEGDASTDDLDMINGGTADDILYLRAADGSRTVVLKHGTGNIVMPNGNDYSLDDANKVIQLIYGSDSKWHLVGSAGGGSQTPWMSDIDANGYALQNLGSLEFSGAGDNTTYSIRYYNSGNSSEKITSLPITVSSPYTKKVVYSVYVGDLVPGDIVLALTDFEATNDHSYNVMIASQIYLASSDLTTTIDAEISEASGFNITPNMHHGVVSRSGALAISDSLTSKYINVLAYAASSAASSGDTLTIEQDYGRLVVFILHPIIIGTPSEGATFTELSDTPAGYAGNSGKTLVVNDTETALIFDDRATVTTSNTVIYVAPSGDDTTGNGSSGNPYATIQKAIDWYRNNASNIAHACKIVLSKGTYTLSEPLSLSGLIITGSLTIEARDTDDNALYDNGSATGGSSTTLEDTAKSWTSDFWTNCWVYIFRGTGAGQYRQISSNTADTLTVSSAWNTTPDSTSEYVIIGAKLDGATNSVTTAFTPKAQNNLNIYGLYFDGFTNYVINPSGCTDLSFKYNLVVSSTGRGLYINQGRVVIDYSFLHVSSYGVLAYGGAYVNLYRSVIKRNGTAGTGYGVWSRFQSTIDMAGGSYTCYIADWDIGCYASEGGLIDSGSVQTFSGNTTDYSPTGTSDPAHIS